MNHFFVNSQIYLVNAMFLAIKGKKKQSFKFFPICGWRFSYQKIWKQWENERNKKNRTRKLKELKAKFLGVLKWS